MNAELGVPQYAIGRGMGKPHLSLSGDKLKDLAPYALIELVLPGGSVMALLLWLYRRQKTPAPLGSIGA
jgi:hypothetical protein